MLFTKHESRLFFETRPLRPFGAPCGEKAELKVTEPKTEIRRPDRRACRQVTTSLRMLTGPFRDILGLLPPGYGLLPSDNGFFTRYASDTPRAGARAPFAVLARLPGARRQPRSRLPPGSLRCGQLQRNPCRERRTFYVALTGSYSG